MIYSMAYLAISLLSILVNFDKIELVNEQHISEKKYIIDLISTQFIRRLSVGTISNPSQSPT